MTVDKQRRDTWIPFWNLKLQRRAVKLSTTTSVLDSECHSTNPVIAWNCCMRKCLVFQHLSCVLLWDPDCRCLCFNNPLQRSVQSWWCGRLVCKLTQFVHWCGHKFPDRVFSYAGKSCDTLSRWLLWKTHVHRITSSLSTSVLPQKHQPRDQALIIQQRSMLALNREMLQSMQSISRHGAENVTLKKTSFDDSRQVQIVYKSMFCHSVSTVAFYVNESVWRKCGALFGNIAYCTVIKSTGVLPVGSSDGCRVARTFKRRFL